MNIFQYNMAQHDKCILLARKYKFAREYDLARFYYNAACKFKQRALDCTFEMCKDTHSLSLDCCPGSESYFRNLYGNAEVSV